jgi:hypothetical protein
MKIKRYWEIQGSKISDNPEQIWKDNIHCHVVASTLEKAIELVKEKYPTIELFTAYHRGKVDSDLIEKGE